MRLTVFLILTACLALLAWPIRAHTAVLVEEQVLHTLRADYLEDEQTGRRLAAIEARLVDVGDGTARLFVIVEAIGPDIDPVQSFRGVHGSNHVTAGDLTRLMEGDHLKVVVLPRHGGGKRLGTVTTRSRGRIPERRQHDDGTIDLHAKSANEFVLGIEAQSPLLRPGEHELYLEVKRIPRLRVDVRLQPTADGALTGTITAIESLGDHTVHLKSVHLKPVHLKTVQSNTAEENR